MKKVLVVTKKSVFELYSRSVDEDVRDYMSGGSSDVKRMKESHRTQMRARKKVLETLESHDFEVTAVSRADFRSTVGFDLVITLGGDGTFLQVSHSIRDIPMLGVTGDPGSSVGFFNAATADTFEEVIRNLDSMPRTLLHRMEVLVNGEPLPKPALNDVLYAHSNPAFVTRYRTLVNGETRRFKSSGFLVCTAAGSTGWMFQEGGEVMPITDTRLQYLSRSVRDERPGFAHEVSLHTLTRLGQIFIDGVTMEEQVPLGSDVTVRGGPHLMVMGDLNTRRSCICGDGQAQ